MKPVTRLIVRGGKMQMVSFDDNGDKKADYNGVEDIYQHVERMVTSVEIHTGKRPNPRKTNDFATTDQNDDGREMRDATPPVG